MKERTKYVFRIVALAIWSIVAVMCMVSFCWLFPIVWLITGYNIYQPLINFSQKHFSDEKLQFPNSK